MEIREKYYELVMCVILGSSDEFSVQLKAAN